MAIIIPSSGDSAEILVGNRIKMQNGNLLVVSTNYLAKWVDASQSLGTVGTAVVTLIGNRASGTTAWASTATANISIAQSSADTTLRGTANYLFTTGGTPASATGATFVETPVFTIEGVDLGKPVSISFDLSGVTADGNFDVAVVRYNSAGTYQETISVAGNASGATVPSAKLLTGTGTFRGFFVSSSTATDLYALRFRRLAGTDVPRIDTLYVGPQTQLLGAAVTDWQSYTPVLTGSTTSPNIGTTGTSTGRWRRLGDSIEIDAVIVAGGAGITSGSGVYSVSLPTGLAIDTAKVVVATGGFASDKSTIGGGNWINTGVTGAFNRAIAYATGGINGIALANNLSDTLVGQNEPTASWFNAAGDGLSVRAVVPISGWSSNVTMGERALEEYAWNSSATTATDTTSFGNGVTGAQFVNATTSISKRVRFQTPIQATDKISLEVFDATSNTWQDSAYKANLINTARQQSATYGLYIDSVNSTDVDVTYGSGGRLSDGAFASAGTSWSGIAATNSFKWRVRKVSGGALVGFPVSGKNVIPEDVIQPPMTISTSVSFGIGVRFVSSGIPTTQTLQLLTTADDGKKITIKNINTGTVTIATTSSQTIDGAATQILNAYESVVLIAYNNAWFII